MDGSASEYNDGSPFYVKMDAIRNLGMGGRCDSCFVAKAFLLIKTMCREDFRNSIVSVMVVMRQRFFIHLPG